MNQKYQILKTKSEIVQLSSYLQRFEEVAFDFETTSLQTHSDKLRMVGAGFGVKEGEVYYIPYNLPELGISSQQIFEELRSFFENDNIIKICQNAKYEYRVLNRFNIELKGTIFDTMVASYCLFSDRFSHSIDEMALNHFGHVKIRTKSVLPSKKGKKKKDTEEVNKELTMEDSPIEDVALYCMDDVDWTFRLKNYYQYLFTLPEYSYSKKLYNEIEQPLIKILAKMESNGVAIDKKVLSSLKEEMIQSVTKLKAQINEVAGEEIALTNPNQISNLLYNKLKLFEKHKLPIKKTKTGKLVTTEKILSQLNTEPVVANILLVKKLNKLLSTYIEPIPEAVSTVTNMLHASFNQHITSTGRLASSDPNLQNIPKREVLGQRIRLSFVSRFPGGKVMSADYSQQELRILAHISGEPVLIETYKNNEDAHINAATMVFKVSKDKVTPSQRNLVKTVQYGILYGAEAQRISQEAKITVPEAEDLIKLYMSRMTHISTFLEDTRKYLKNHGYVETLCGRRRYIPKVYSPIRYIRSAAFREAGNAVVQGTAADQVKLAMAEIDKFLRDKKSILTMQVHDEIVMDIHPDELAIVPYIADIMRNALKLSVPMEVEAKLANNWQEAH